MADNLGKRDDLDTDAEHSLKWAAASIYSGTCACECAPHTLLIRVVYTRRGRYGRLFALTRVCDWNPLTITFSQTVSAMHTFILAMTLYPDIQKRAQAEIDAVVGNGRLPSFEDRENLPFVEALVKETLRWRCPAPLSTSPSCTGYLLNCLMSHGIAFPHRCMEDDVHDGYFIPKGTIVFANIWYCRSSPRQN